MKQDGLVKKLKEEYRCSKIVIQILQRHIKKNKKYLLVVPSIKMLLQETKQQALLFKNYIDTSNGVKITS